MSFDFSTLIWILIAAMVVQPLLMGRWFSLNALKPSVRSRRLAGPGSSR